MRYKAGENFMADQNNQDADIIRMLEESDGTRDASDRTLESIDRSMKKMLEMMDRMSQSAMFDKRSTSASGVFSDRYADRSMRRKFGSAKQGLEAGIREGIADALGVGDLKKTLNSAFRGIAKDLGVSIEDLPNMFGEEIGKRVISRMPKKLTDMVRSRTARLEGEIAKNLRMESGSKAAPQSASASAKAAESAAKLGNSPSSGSGVKGSASSLSASSVVIYADAVYIRDSSSGGSASDAISKFAGDSLGGETGGAAEALAGAGETAEGAAELAEGAAGAAESVAGVGGAMDALMPIVTSLGPEIMIAVAAFSLVKGAISPFIEGTKKLLKSLGDSWNRYDTSMKANIKSAQDRLKQDVETMVRTPFEILEKAATEWYDAWDSNLRTITATQGYNKTQLQELYASFADRLRSENLTSVVSAADIADNLKSVLEAGLSGQVAEEFAYMATKLNAMIPTQDFFGYAGTYASIAANAIRMGKSQSDAIAEANAQIESFASNILYASREVAGGFTTGLKDAESIFQQSVQIAQAGKTNNSTAIAGVMTAVSAITGAIAPDLATAMTDAIYKAAVGGNSSEIVALRSLAGINASNTEFLKQLANDPQSVFSNLFRELANRQSMSADAYMEVAEGLSSVFGISADAFARVDFAYLAEAIESMTDQGEALDQNLALLASGETTTTAEQLKMQKINETILNEGLSYVLDNEAARAVQQHMWQEQIAREIQETTYAVEVQGALLEFVQSIAETVRNIMMFFNPLMWFEKIADVATTASETKALEKDIQQVLELGKVGSGNNGALYALTHRNENLGITDNLVSILGGTSKFAQAEADLNDMRWFNNSTALAKSNYASTADYSRRYQQRSLYRYGIVGKSTSMPGGAWDSSKDYMSHEVSQMAQITASSAAAQETANTRIMELISSMDAFIDENQTAGYDEWLKTSKNYGISDLGAALETVGLTEHQVQSQYETLQMQLASQQEVDRKQKESQFWDDTSMYQLMLSDNLEMMKTHIEDSTESLFIYLDNQHELMGEMYDAEVQIITLFESFEDMWTKYFIEHTVYKSAFNSSDVERVQREEKNESQTAVLALADALTKNSVDMLVDPTLQTNALLAAILQTANAILTSTNSPNANAGLINSFNGLLFGSQE